MFFFLLPPALAGVLINEVLYDPTSSDDGLEWIELCNDGAAVDLTGWTIETAGSSWGECFTLAAGTIANGEYVLIGSGGNAWGQHAEACCTSDEMAEFESHGG